MAGRTSLDRFVAPAEYLPVKADTGELADVYRRSIYRAVFISPDIEQFLYLGSDISRHTYVVGKFGFRAAVAESFSVAALAAMSFRLFFYRLFLFDRPQSVEISSWRPIRS